MTTKPRPLFIYGTLCAAELLATILGEPSDKTPPMLQAATVKGYERRSKYFGSGYALQPAAITSEDQEATIEGYLLKLENRSQRRKLDNFEAEGEAHKSVPVQVHISATGQMVPADMYLWNGPMEEISLSLGTLTPSSEMDWRTFSLFLRGWSLMVKMTSKL